jgi:hypothetical protein
MIIGKRYIFVATDDRTFTGLVVNSNDAIIDH